MIVLGEVQSPPLHYGMLHIELAVIHIVRFEMSRIVKW